MNQKATTDDDVGVDSFFESARDHFFTKIVQRKSLIDGAALASTMGDAGAATYYLQQAALIIPAIDASHWNAATNIIEESRRPYTGPQKYLGLDVAVIIGALLGSTPQHKADNYSPTSGRVLSTTQNFVDSLGGVYATNTADDSRGVPGFLVGR
jgi:glucoamylase